MPRIRKQKKPKSLTSIDFALHFPSLSQEKVSEEMYSAIRSLPLDVSVGDYQGSLDGTNLPGDACLVLTTDPRPRLRWTAELHERFVDAVTQLGGPDSEFLFLGYLCFCFKL